MGIVFRQSVKATIVILTGNIIGALFNYFSIYTFKTDLQGFGFVRTILNIGAIFQFVVLLGTSSLIQTFTQRYTAEDERKKLLITLCTIVPVAVTLLLLPFYQLFKAPIIRLFHIQDQAYVAAYYWWVPVLTLLWAYMALYEAYMVAEHKTAQAVFMREVLLRVCNMFLLAAFYYQLISFHIFLTGIILCYAVPALVLLLLALRTPGFGFSVQWHFFSRKEYRELAHFSWYHMLVGVTTFLIGVLDTLMLATLDKDGVASVPVYAMASFLAILMLIPYRAISNAAYPVLNRAYLDDQQEELKSLFNRSGNNIQIVAVAMTILMSCNLGNLVAILPSGYHNIATLLLILMLGRLADMITGLNSEIISISKYYKFNFRISILLVLSLVVLYRLLIPGYGAIGAAWATAGAMVMINIAKMIFLKSKMGLSPFSGKSFTIFIAGGIAAVAVLWIPMMVNPFFDVIVRSGVILIVYSVLLWRMRSSKDLNNYISSVVKNKRLY